jgi:hypothetical protein
MFRCGRSTARGHIRARASCSVISWHGRMTGRRYSPFRATPLITSKGCPAHRRLHASADRRREKSPAGARQRARFQNEWVWYSNRCRRPGSLPVGEWGSSDEVGRPLARTDARTARIIANPAERFQSAPDFSARTLTIVNRAANLGEKKPRRIGERRGSQERVLCTLVQAGDVDLGAD